MARKHSFNTLEATIVVENKSIQELLKMNKRIHRFKKRDSTRKK
jgi:hypothetical protein